MSLENWVTNSGPERRDSDAAEIARLLALADGRLEDYHKAVAGKLSSDVQLGLAYDAIRISATAAQGKADQWGKMAVRVRKEVEDWIRKNHVGQDRLRPSRIQLLNDHC
jgi:hypothetical protein